MATNAIEMVVVEPRVLHSAIEQKRGLDLDCIPVNRRFAVPDLKPRRGVTDQPRARALGYAAQHY
jgi:hypothetical protein